MLKNIVCSIAVATLTVAAATAQTKPAPPAKAETKAEASAPKTPPEPAPLPVNIKIEVSITDQSGSGTPAKKVVSMIASDRQSTNIRSSASVPVPSVAFGKPSGATESTPASVPLMQSYTYRNVTINVDARPAIVQKEPNRISLSLGLEYIPRTEGRQEEMAPGMASWSERLWLILESGKPMIVSQAADPTSDRKITVEVTATILK
jgi:hypothetical protein